MQFLSSVYAVLKEPEILEESMDKDVPNHQLISNVARWMIKSLKVITFVRLLARCSELTLLPSYNPLLPGIDGRLGTVIEMEFL